MKLRQQKAENDALSKELKDLSARLITIDADETEKGQLLQLQKQEIDKLKKEYKKALEADRKEDRERIESLKGKVDKLKRDKKQFMTNTKKEKNDFLEKIEELEDRVRKGLKRN